MHSSDRSQFGLQIWPFAGLASGEGDLICSTCSLGDGLSTISLWHLPWIPRQDSMELAAPLIHSSCLSPEHRPWLSPLQRYPQVVLTLASAGNGRCERGDILQLQWVFNRLLN